MTYPLIKIRITPAGTGYQRSSNLVYLLDPGAGLTSLQVRFGGSQDDLILVID